MNKIGSKIFGIIFLLVLVCIICAGFLNYNSTKKYSLALFDDISKISLRAAYTTVNTTINVEATQYLKAMATSITTHSSQNVRSVIEDAMYMIHYPKIYVAFNGGKNLISYMDESFFPIDSLSWDENINLTQEVWYKAVEKSLKLYIGDTRDLEDGPFKGRKVATVAYPIKRGGDFFGVIAVDVFVDKFQNRFNSFASSKLNSQGIFLLDSSNKLFSYENNEILTESNSVDFQNKLSNELKKDNLEGSFYFTNTLNKPQKAFYKKFHFGWSVVTTARDSELTTIIFKKVILDTISSISFFCLFGILLFVLIRKTLSKRVAL